MQVLLMVVLSVVESVRLSDLCCDGLTQHFLILVTGLLSQLLLLFRSPEYGTAVLSSHVVSLKHQSSSKPKLQMIRLGDSSTISQIELKL